MKHRIIQKYIIPCMAYLAMGAFILFIASMLVIAAINFWSVLS